MIEILIGIPLTIWRAFVLTSLWLWFIVPIGVVQIGLFHMMGVSFICEMLCKRVPSSKYDSSLIMTAW